MVSEYRSFKHCIYRLDVDKDGIYCKAFKLVSGEWEPLELTLRAMLLIDSDGIHLSHDQAINSKIETIDI